MATVTEPAVSGGADGTAPETPTPTPEPADRPRETGGWSTDDLLSLVGSLVGSLALVWVLYERVFGVSGAVGFLVCWYLAFLATYVGVSLLGNPWVVVKDRLSGAVVTGAALVVAAALLSTVLFTVFRGLPALVHPNFYTHDMEGVRPNAPLDQGGVFHAIVGSFIEVGIAASLALPLGIGTAVYLTEVGGRGSMLVRTVVEAMTALPDILAGLFIYVVLIVYLGFERSGFAAGMALFVMMLPIIARSAEVQLRIVPGGLREAGLALGASRWRTVRLVVLPTAKAGLATALILGVARAVGETAPVLITSGASTITNFNPFKDPMNSLPLFTLSAVRSGLPNYITRGFGAATILLVIVFVLFGFIRFLTRDRGPAR